MKVFVIAASQKEAEEIARDRPDVVHKRVFDASKHLKAVQAPPTDPYYAVCRVYSVTTKGGQK